MKSLVLSASFLFIFIMITAQIPQGFNYQAVAHSNTGAAIMNATIQVRVGILSDTITPVIVLEELHSTVKTNASGVFSLVIGTGTRQSGSASEFSSIDWSITPLYLKIQIYYQNAWKYLGTSKLWSVPFAMASGTSSGLTGVQTEINAIETGAGLNDNGAYSANASANYIASATNLKDADNKIDAQVKINSDKIAASSAKMLIKGTETSTDSALFRIVNKDGQTVFAVYNEGVRIYVDNGSKGKGGFSVGGFASAKAPSQDLLFIDADSIRAYINTDPAKATKGGFAIGGFSSSKAVSQDLLVVNADSIRAYIGTSTEKGAKGGFAVGGFDAVKGTGEEYLRVTRDSTRIYLNDAPAKGAKGGFAVGGFSSSKGLPNNYMLINPDSTRFYVRDLGTGNSSTFNIVGIDLNQTQRSLFSANSDTVGIAGVFNVIGNINYTGTVNLIVPEVITLEPFDVTDSSAMVMCDIISNGGAAVIASGIVWSISPNPTVDLATKSTDGTSLGQYSSLMTGLTETTTYYVRAYATNANGTGYGSEISFTTVSSGSYVADYDGNVYNVVVIGTQTWIASNLRTTSYNDGSPIPNVKNDTAWLTLSTPGYAWYNNDSVTYSDYGILYNWATVNTGLLCPTGWHVPTETEWFELQTQLGGFQFAGDKLKETGTAHWLAPNTNATNETGFTALPGGSRSYMGSYFGVGETGTWWSSTMISVDPAMASISYATGELMISMTMGGTGQSVRCLQDVAN